MHLKRISFWCLCSLILLSSCKPNLYLNRTQSKDLETMFQADDMNHHMGFLIKDLATGQTIESIDADQYYTPASNTKVLTLALGMAALGDSIPFIDYYDRGDTLYIRGLGDPTFLHPDFDQERSIRFLKSYKTIALDQSNFRDRRYGRGWSWDDYNGAYQVERSAFPIYGNKVVFNDEAPAVDYFNDQVTYHPGEGPLYVRRNRRENRFDVYGKKGSNRLKNVPLVISNQLVEKLLQDTLNNTVIEGIFDQSVSYRTMYSHPVDSLYQPMMQRSDNFFADQIIMMASQSQLGYIDESEIMQWTSKNVFKSPDELLWFDGSGLSRYNQITPRSMVYLFQKLEKEYGLKRLISILAEGGNSGTIKNWYSAKDGQPFVFAKTGTIRNVHCLSGYLKAESGKWYVFSFMHNNFPGGSSTVKEPMQQILQYLKEQL